MEAFTGDHYETPADLLGKPGPFPSLSFYGRITPIVFKASAVAKRGEFGDEEWGAASRRVGRVFEKLGVPIKFEGLEVLDRFEGPCVFIGNHMSTAETFLLAWFLLSRKRVTFVVKRALVEMPVFKHIMISRDPIVVGRENPREDLKTVLTDGISTLKSGTSVIVFPQRTRMVEFRPAEFNTIGIKLARRAKVPVVPLALKTDAWANGRKFKDFGPFNPAKPVHFALGEPLSLAGSDQAANQEVVSFIQSKLAEWEREDSEWQKSVGRG